jgi:hypothetical protein
MRDVLCMNEQDLIMCAPEADQASAPAAATERPLRICVVSDDEASAENAEVLIRHVTSDYQRDTQSFLFDELDPPGPSITAARSVCNTDILVIAVSEERMLPAHVKLWLDLCLALRDEDQEGALVLVISNAVETAYADSPLMECLNAVAALGRLTVFPQPRSPARSPGQDHALSMRRAQAHSGLSARFRQNYERSRRRTTTCRCPAKLTE